MAVGIRLNGEHNGDYPPKLSIILFVDLAACQKNDFRGLKIPTDHNQHLAKSSNNADVPPLLTTPQTVLKLWLASVVIVISSTKDLPILCCQLN